MSGDDNRDLFEHDTGAQNGLLDELDSLKDLLNGEEGSFSAPDSDPQDPDIPLLDEVIDIDATGTPGDSAIPVLDEVAFPEEIPVLEELAFPEEIPELEELAYPKEHPAPQPSQQAESTAEPAPPSEQELSKLIDMLVGHRLRRLRPKIKEEVMEELRRLYPELFR
jgi:hypothetical protein